MPIAAFAALAMLIATGFFAGTTLLAKALGGETLGLPVHALQISQARFVFGFVAVALVLALMPRHRRALPAGTRRPAWGLHLVRTLLGWLGGALLFAAAARMPLTDANALSFLSPIATMLLAIPLLGERVGVWRWVAAGLSLTGALVLLRPGSGVVDPAALLALGAALAMGLEGVFIKRLAGREPPQQIMLVNNAMGAIIASLAVIPVFYWPEMAAQWLALAAVGVFMVSGQILLLLAFARADASYATPFLYLVLVWAALFDTMVFGVLPDGASITGAANIILGGLMVAWREARLKRR
ncbi:MAG: DMT family transporter [Pararhodobacter sp.]|nr:DMT family transporter [Pararhodobacter sp.]